MKRGISLYNTTSSLTGKKGTRCLICTGCGRCPGVIRGMQVVTEKLELPPLSLQNPEGIRLMTVDIGTTTIAMQLYDADGKINYADASPECLTEVEENKGTAETALQWARANRPDKVNDTGTENSTDYTTGGILTFSFHWFSPLGGRDKSFYTEHTDFDAAKILQEGTPERAAFYHDMDAIAGILQPPKPKVHCR